MGGISIWQLLILMSTCLILIAIFYFFFCLIRFVFTSFKKIK